MLTTIVRGREDREGAILLLIAAAGLVLTATLTLTRSELRQIDRAAVTKQARLASSR